MGQEPKEYIVVWFIGEPNLKQKAVENPLELTEDGLTLHSEPERVVPFEEIRDVAVGRINKLGTVVRLSLASGNLSMSIPRMNFGGYFVVINSFATRRLCRVVREAWNAAGAKQRKA
jgi:hypothetical protein